MLVDFHVAYFVCFVFDDARLPQIPQTIRVYLYHVYFLDWHYFLYGRLADYSCR